MDRRSFAHHPWLTGLGGFAALVVLLALVWDWNWFKPLVEHQASKALGRAVTIGHFDVDLGRHPLLVADKIEIANPPDFPADSEMATIDRLAVRVVLSSLLHGPLRLPEVAIEHPHGDLGPGPDGHYNWEFAGSGGGGGAVPEIGEFTISDGDLHIVDPKRKIDFMLTIRTQEAGEALPGDKPRTGTASRIPPNARTPQGPSAEEPRVVVTAKGTYTGQPLQGRLIGGSLLALRDRETPYPVDLQLRHGATQVLLKGTVDDPLHFAGTKLALDLRGDDLAELFPLTNIPFQPTPAYRLRGGLEYAEGRFRFRNFAGTVGNSDLSGNLAVDPGKERPLVTADFLSKRVVLADLAGFIGAPPGKPDSPADSHKQERAQQEASPRLIPNTPISLPKLRAADMKVTYKATRIESQSTPLDNLFADLSVENGKLSLRPLKFGVGRGEIAGTIALDAQQNLVHAVADVDFRQLDLQRIMQTTKSFEGFGTIGGKMKIDTTGNSLAQMLARGDGALQLFMTGGEISALLVTLAGLDIGRSALAALGNPDKAQIRCMITDFALEQGILNTRLMLLDTTEANILGKGSINLRNEQADLRIESEPKHFSVGSLNTPILVRGALKSPSILPEPAEFGAKTGLAAAFGALLTPLGALLPTIQLGLGKDTDCDGVLNASATGGNGNAPRRDAGRGAAPPPNQPRR